MKPVAQALIPASLHLLILVFSAAALAADFPVAKLHCPSECGSVTVPFPFGISPGCFLDEEFFINCTADPDSPRALLWKSEFKVTNISLAGQLTIMQPIAYQCYDKSGSITASRYPTIPLSRPGRDLSNFTVSSTANKFTVVGCDTSGFVEGRHSEKRGNYRTGCLAMCESRDDLSDGSCSGLGCCKTSIPREVSRVTLTLNSSARKYADVWDFSRCGFAFVAEEAAFNFSAASLTSLMNVRRLPMIVDWAVGNGNCEKARSSSTSACISQHSVCQDLDDTSARYRCSCKEGYQGNPYLTDGCQDIDECKDPSRNNCSKKCNNLPGSYECYCPKGYSGDGWKNGTLCTANQHLELKLGLGISLGILPFLLFGWLSLILQKKKLAKTRQKYLEKNGGSLVREGTAYGVKQYTEHQLNKATDHFSRSWIISEGISATVYKCHLPEDPHDKWVSIKKYNEVDKKQSGSAGHKKIKYSFFTSLFASKKEESGLVKDRTNAREKKAKEEKERELQVRQFIIELTTVFKMNHKNAVMLRGCCLETRVPLLVYEYVGKETLHDHLDDPRSAARLSWEMRFKIATEIADVLSYFHTKASPPVIHGDIKSANIHIVGAMDLSTLTVKVSDFGASRVARSFHQTKLTTLVEESRGYLDPEYIQTKIPTEQSDVYSFGVVLFELLTGRKAFDDDGVPEEEQLLTNFVKNKEGEQLFQVLDDVVKKGKKELVMEVAKLAKSCVNLREDERLSMEEIDEKLKILKGSEMVPPGGSRDAGPREKSVSIIIDSPENREILQGDDGDTSARSS